VRILGVDEFALRRGHRYGTVSVDVAGSEVVDRLPERSADSLVTWLTARDRPEISCRDRGGEYASGARQGAPDAIQIADRFHLQQNTSQVRERILRRHATALRTCVSQPVGPGATEEETTEEETTEEETTEEEGPPDVPAASTTRKQPEPPRQDRRRAR
jgi:transposase